jgi:hypothetical protein
VSDHGEAKDRQTESDLLVPGRRGQNRLAGDFTGWEQAPVGLKKDKGGVWKKTLALPPGRYEYRLLVDGQWRDDPQCINRRPNQFGGQNCVCVVDAGQIA